jgi:hypothetical protein
MKRIDSEPDPNAFAEVARFLARQKKWYLVPTAAVILLFAVLLALGGTAAAPFIYTLF